MLRLLADDLTGALDSAAPFAAARGPLPIIWTGTACRADDGDFAFDSETRDADDRSAAARAGTLAAALAIGEATIAFKKIDSCLRGQPAAEIAAVVAAGGFRSTVVAAAFPRHGRITRGGRQWLSTDGAWRDLGIDIGADLAGRGLEVAHSARPAGAGVFVCDAETEGDLERIADCGRALAAPILWCGAGGLARALAGAGAMIDAGVAVRPPVLVLMGSGHPTTSAQLAALGPAPGRGVAVHRLTLPPSAAPAAARIALEGLVASAAAGPPPATVIVAGGETLMRLCTALGTARLVVKGEVEPGVPLSAMEGGAWAGTWVVSKSGGFGDLRLLVRLLAPAMGNKPCGATR
jgi:D-threonate/D-erythronate kinase